MGCVVQRPHWEDRWAPSSIFHQIGRGHNIGSWGLGKERGEDGEPMADSSAVR